MLAEARKIVGAKFGVSPSALLSFDSVYFRLAGLANPLPEGAGKTVATLRSAVRKRRDAGVRWETLAASIEATLGRPVSVREAREIYASAKGSDLGTSYVGRGTRAGAPATRESAAAAIEATIG